MVRPLVKFLNCRQNLFSQEVLEKTIIRVLPLVLVLVDPMNHDAL